MRIALLAAPALAALCLLVAPAQSQDDPSRETAPPAPAPATEEAALAAAMDRELAAVWQRDGIKPAEIAGDAEFLRRAYLDTTGAPPTREEAEAFLADDAADKRARLVDALTADPRFGRHLANSWSVALVPRDANPISGSQLFAHWLAGEFNGGVSFKAIIRKVVTARGELADNPALVPWFAGGEAVMATDMAGKLSRALAGVQIQCAECHDHPYDKQLTQAAFEGMASFVVPGRGAVDNAVRPARVTLQDDPEIARRVQDFHRRRASLPPEQRQLAEKYIRYIKPRAPDGFAPPADKPQEWRAALAGWMVADKNAQTRRYVANRMWALAFGSGIVNPVDDFNTFNEPSHPAMLDLMADDLLRHDWDVRRLYRAILKTRAWQLASRPVAGAQPWHFASHAVRPLAPEQFIASLLNLLTDGQVQEAVLKVREEPLQQAREQWRRDEKERRPNQPQVRNDFAALDRFEARLTDMPERWFLARWGAGRYATLSADDEMTQGESLTLSMDQALAVMNGPFTNALAGSGEEGLLGRIGERFARDSERLEAIYLSVLSRRPSAAESERWLARLGKARDDRAFAEDLLFALLMSTEFATNH